MQVRHDRGRIIEENHYYAFGLKIAAISSKAYGAPNNNYLYQGDFSDFDDDLGWNDFELRSYDPQICRFLQNDPYDQFASGYVGMGNDPVNTIDPSGGWAATGIFQGMSQAGIMATTTLGGAIIGGVVDALTGGSGFTGAAIGAGIGLGSNFASAFNWRGLVSVLGKAAPSIAEGVNQYARYANIDDTWPDLTKERLYNFVKAKCQGCGEGTIQQKTGVFFEDLFESWFKSQNYPRGKDEIVAGTLTLNKLERGTKQFTRFRNTVPDYLGTIIFQNGKVKTTYYYNVESFIELKATKQPTISLSSFTYQLKAQIITAKNAGIKYVILITTAGVKLSSGLYKYARKRGVTLRHFKATYYIDPRGDMSIWPEEVPEKY